MKQYSNGTKLSHIILLVVLLGLSAWFSQSTAQEPEPNQASASVES